MCLVRLSKCGYNSSFHRRLPMKSRLGRGVVGISSPIVGSVHSFSPAFGSLGRRVWSKSGELSGKKRRILVESPAFCAEPSAFSFAFFGLFSLFSPNPSMNPGRALVSVGEKAESRVPRVTINAYLCRTLLLFSSIRSLRAVPDGAISCLCLLLPVLPSAP